MHSKLLMATRNRGKIAELRRLLAPANEIELVSVYDVEPTVEVREDGETFAANACKKALAFAQRLRMLTLADDSGLEVDALGGAPGVYSARFAGTNATDGENNRKLLQALADVPGSERTARFRCVLALADWTGELASQPHVEEGTCEGRIVGSPRGIGGFGYDPLFIPDGQDRTMAELRRDEKNLCSHRALAAAKMRAFLQGYFQRPPA